MSHNRFGCGISCLGARVAALEAKVEEALRTAADAVTAAENALRRAQAVAGKMATLRAKGTIDLPVLIETL